MKNKLKYFAINGMYAAAFFLAIRGNAGAENIALVFTWILISVSPLMLIALVTDKAAEAGRRPSVPRAFDITYDIGIMMCMAYIGWVVTPILYLVQIAVVSLYWDAIKKKTEKLNADKEDEATA